LHFQRISFAADNGGTQPLNAVLMDANNILFESSHCEGYDTCVTIGKDLSAQGIKITDWSPQSTGFPGTNVVVVSDAYSVASNQLHTNDIDLAMIHGPLGAGTNVTNTILDKIQNVTITGSQVSRYSWHCDSTSGKCNVTTSYTGLPQAYTGVTIAPGADAASAIFQRFTSTQTHNIQEYQTETGTLLSAIDKTGGFTGNLTGTAPTAPTQPGGDNSTKVATTAYVNNAAGGYLVSFCDTEIGAANATEYVLLPAATSNSAACNLLASTNKAETPMPISCIAKNLYANSSAPGSVGTSGLIQVYKNGTPDANFKCTLGISNPSKCNDTTHNVSFSP